MIRPQTFDWVSGTSFHSDPEAAWDELIRIRNANNGELSAEAILEASRDKSSVLHRDIFSLSQAKAAREYYLERARRLPRSIRVTYSEAPTREVAPFRVVTIHRRRPETGRRIQVWDPTDEALASPEKRAEVLARALRDLARCRRVYADLSELTAVFSAIDELLVSQG